VCSLVCDRRLVLYAGIRSGGHQTHVSCLVWIHPLLGLSFNQRRQVVPYDASAYLRCVSHNHLLDGVTTSGSQLTPFLRQAQDRTQDKPFDAAQDKPFDAAQDKLPSGRDARCPAFFDRPLGSSKTPRASEAALKLCCHLRQFPNVQDFSAADGSNVRLDERE